jgi:hypothetical protein
MPVKTSPLRLRSSGQSRKRRTTPALVFGLVSTLAWQVFLFFAPTSAAAASQEPQSAKRQALGSLTATGEVYVNDKAAPAEATIFAGDTVRTGEASTAVFTMPGNGALKLGPRTQIVISGDRDFAAEFQAGTAVIDSSSGPSGIKLRVGNFVVVPVAASKVTSAKIEGQSGATFQVTCLEGQIFVVPTPPGGPGQFLEAGQSVGISARGELVFPKSAVKSSVPSPGGVHMGKTGWTLLGVAGAAGGAAAAALGHHGSSNSVSPSAP